MLVVSTVRMELWWPPVSNRDSTECSAPNSNHCHFIFFMKKAICSQIDRGGVCGEFPQFVLRTSDHSGEHAEEKEPVRGVYSASVQDARRLRADGHGGGDAGCVR